MSRSENMLKKLLPLFVLPLLWTGCATPFVITNLTPLQQTRTTNNLYTVEAAVASRQQTLRWDTMRPQIVVGNEIYQMRPTMLMSNRFEGSIPVPPGTTSVNYHYKFDFQYNSWGAPGNDSVLSKPYKLQITEQ